MESSRSRHQLHKNTSFLMCLMFLQVITVSMLTISVNCVTVVSNTFEAQHEGWIAPVSSVITRQRQTRATEQPNRNLSELPWYLGGKKMPTLKQSRDPLLPEEAPNEDRIINQLMYLPTKVTKKKTILVWDEEYYMIQGCPINACLLTRDRKQYHTADAIIFQFASSGLPLIRNPHQRWIFYCLESPMNSLDLANYEMFNWTATYRQDSDFVYPYHNWVYFDKNIRQMPVAPYRWIFYCLESPMNSLDLANYEMFNWTATYRQDSDFVYPYHNWVYFDKNIRQMPVAPNVASKKTKKVAWYVSNCNADSNRLEYARELSKYIDVDIYGKCGTKQCSRSKTGNCLEMLRQEYKFYLSFENSVCKDYVTEKFFYALQYSILPIALGATKEYYTKLAPQHSFIHVDDFNSPKELAEHLHKLDQNDDLYNEYFRWHGTGKFLEEHAFFICRLCAMLHGDLPEKTYTDINRFRSMPGECSFRPQGVGAPKRGLQYW